RLRAALGGFRPRAASTAQVGRARRWPFAAGAFLAAGVGAVSLFLLLRVQGPPAGRELPSPPPHAVADDDGARAALKLEPHPSRAAPHRRERPALLDP